MRATPKHRAQKGWTPWQPEPHHTGNKKTEVPVLVLLLSTPRYFHVQRILSDPSDAAVLALSQRFFPPPAALPPASIAIPSSTRPPPPPLPLAASPSPVPESVRKPAPSSDDGGSSSSSASPSSSPKTPGVEQPPPTLSPALASFLTVGVWVVSGVMRTCQRCVEIAFRVCVCVHISLLALYLK